MEKWIILTFSGGFGGGLGCFSGGHPIFHMNRWSLLSSPNSFPDHLPPSTRPSVEAGSEFLRS